MILISNLKEACFMAGNYYPPFSLRISEGLLEKIKYLASLNKRSANKEIEFILEQHIRKYEEINGTIPSNSNQQ